MRPSGALPTANDHQLPFWPHSKPSNNTTTSVFQNGTPSAAPSLPQIATNNGVTHPVSHKANGQTPIPRIFSANGTVAEQLTWSSTTWRSRPALQQPRYTRDNLIEYLNQRYAQRSYAPVDNATISPPQLPKACIDDSVTNGELLEMALEPLKQSNDLVSYSEVLSLQAKLRRVAEGRAFLLHAGDCAERFDDATENVIREKTTILTMMKDEMMKARMESRQDMQTCDAERVVANVKRNEESSGQGYCNEALSSKNGDDFNIVMIGRIAGQYGKPRTEELEKVKCLHQRDNKFHHTNVNNSNTNGKNKTDNNSGSTQSPASKDGGQTRQEGIEVVNGIKHGHGERKTEVDRLCDVEGCLGVLSLPSFRGDNVNSIEANEIRRKHDIARLIQGHETSKKTIGILSLVVKEYKLGRGGLSVVEHLHKPSDIHDYTCQTGTKSGIMECKESEGEGRETSNDDVYISHEGLILAYEEACVREVTDNGQVLHSYVPDHAKQTSYYDSSAHLLWIGTYTQQIFIEWHVPLATLIHLSVLCCLYIHLVLHLPITLNSR